MWRFYLLGLLHDGTERPYTYRIAQNDRDYINFVAQLVRKVGAKAWTYREGKNRSVHIVEFRKSLLRDLQVETWQEKVLYARGYFDAEGGLPHKEEDRLYIYAAQKDLRDLEWLRRVLHDLGIRCGKLHNPSRVVDPQYWRFYVRANSHARFAEIIGSWHPLKGRILQRHLGMGMAPKPPLFED